MMIVDLQFYVVTSYTVDFTYIYPVLVCIVYYLCNIEREF